MPKGQSSQDYDGLKTSAASWLDQLVAVATRIQEAHSWTAEAAHHENFSNPRCRVPMGFMQAYCLAGCSDCQSSAATKKCYCSTQIHDYMPCWRMAQLKKVFRTDPSTSHCFRPISGHHLALFSPRDI
uniref:Uncharacterized protein n=1 Tax=Leersia perrieri TaxID=77586 RepID=A0A0D9V344_9ORYZ